MKTWDRTSAFGFAMNACLFYWALCIVGSFGPNFTLTIHKLDYSIETKFILLTAAALIPALYCFFSYPECRSSLWKLNANWKVYLVAIGAGLLIPSSSYLGSRYPEFPWGGETASYIARVFALNLLWSPLWEEVIWRGCFLNKVRSFYSAPRAILLMSVWWTVWHGGYIAFLYSGGVPIKELTVLPFTYFLSGVIFGSVFEMGRGSLWPCVLLHTAFNAATSAYYTTNNRNAELGSYIAELVFMAVAAAVFLAIAVRKGRSSEPLTALSTEQPMIRPPRGDAKSHGSETPGQRVPTEGSLRMPTWLRLLLVLMTVGGGFTGLSYTVDAFGGFEKHGLFTGLVGLAFICFYVFVIFAGLLFVYDSRRTEPILVALAFQIPSVSLPVFEYHISAGSYFATVLVLPQGPGLVGTHVEWSAQLGAFAQFRFADLQEGPAKVGINLFAVFLFVLLRLSVRGSSRSPEAHQHFPPSKDCGN